MGGRSQATTIQSAASPYTMRRVPGTNTFGNWNTGGERASIARRDGSATFGPRAQLNPLADPLGADPRIETLLAMSRGGSQPTYDPNGPMPRMGNMTRIPFNPNGAMPDWWKSGR